MGKSLKDQISDQLGKAQKPEFRQAYDALKKIADGIRDAVSAGHPGTLQAELEPGFVTNLGQQFRLRLRIPSRKWEETLLRAYIPMNGFPVQLDLDGETPVQCADAAELERTVLEFLRRPEIDTRLSIVRESL